MSVMISGKMWLIEKNDETENDRWIRFSIQNKGHGQQQE